MTWVLKEKWLWFIVLGITLVLTLPFVIIWVILNLPPTARMIVTIAVIILWGIVAGYKDWLISKRGEKNRSKSSNA